MSTTLFFLEMAGVGSSFSIITCFSNTPEFLIELGIVEVDYRDGYIRCDGRVTTDVFFRLSLAAILISSFSKEFPPLTSVWMPLAFGD